MTKPNTPLPKEVRRELAHLDLKYDHCNDEKKICDSSCENQYSIEEMRDEYVGLLYTALENQKSDLAEKINNLDYQLAKDHDKLHRFGQFSERLVRRSDVLNLLK